MDDLSKIEPWISGIMAQLKPSSRKTLSLRIGRIIRAANAKRIRTNKTPDGSAMAKRKRKTRIKTKTGKVQKSGRMFRQISRASNLRVNAAPNSVEVGFNDPNIADTAATHHFGLTGFVGKTPRGQVIKTKYTPRPLLGMGDNDEDAIFDAVEAFLDDDLTP